MPVKSDQQLKYNDCGISVIKSIFNYYKINIDRDYIVSQVSLDSNGAWLQDIKTFFEQNMIILLPNIIYSILIFLKFNVE